MFLCGTAHRVLAHSGRVRVDRERGEGEEGRWTKNESDLYSRKYALGESINQLPALPSLPHVEFLTNCRERWSQRALLALSGRGRGRFWTQWSW